MIRLYKRDDEGKFLAYHEAWVEPENRRIVEHWGLLGEDGETDTYRIKLLGSLSKQFNGILDPARGEGFAEINEGDYACLIIEYAITGGGSDEDFEKRENLIEALNQKLGWTGLGYCEGGDTGSDKMNVACFVVDYDLAAHTIEAVLKDTEFGDYSRIYQE